jgi:hypothetical protein
MLMMLTLTLTLAMLLLIISPFVGAIRNNDDAMV